MTGSLRSLVHDDLKFRNVESIEQWFPRNRGNDSFVTVRHNTIRITPFGQLYIYIY